MSDPKDTDSLRIAARVIKMERCLKAIQHAVVHGAIPNAQVTFRRPSDAQVDTAALSDFIAAALK